MRQRGYGRADECAGLENQRWSNTRRFESYYPRPSCNTDFNGLFALILLKIVKIIETFAFWFCTLWVPSPLEGEMQADWKTEYREGGLDEEGDTSGGNDRSSRYAGLGARCYGAGDHHDDERRRHHHDGRWGSGPPG